MTAADFLRRLERTTVVVVAVLAAAVWVAMPGRPRVALGVVGGGVLVAVSYWAIRGVIAGNSRRWALVNFFTRHAILAVAGYGMMTRLELHPVGLLMGVTAPAVAAGIEAFRTRRP